MDKGIVNRKLLSKPSIGATQSAINKDIVLASRILNGYRHSNIELSSGRSRCSSTTNSSRGNSDINTGRNSFDIRIHNSDDFYRHGNNLVDCNGHNRQTVYIDNPTKLYKKRHGLSNGIFLGTNDSNSKHSVFDKAKWTQKREINRNVAVNTSYTNVSNYQGRSFPDNGAHGFNVRPDSNYKDNSHCYFPRQIHSETNDFLRPQSGDYRIRIPVNQSDDYTRDSDHSSRISEECESAESVTIVEIDDRSSEEENTPIFIRNSLNTPEKSTPGKPINTSIQPYTEKAVDVPEEFERKAYESQRSPFVRQIQSNSQIHRRRPPIKKPVNAVADKPTKPNMGNGCTKNIRTSNKNTVVPADVSKPATPIVISHIEPVRINVTQSATTRRHSIEIGPSTSRSANRNGRQTSMCQTLNHSAKTDDKNSSNFHTDNSDITSIIFDKVEPTIVKPFVARSLSNDSQSDRSAEIKVNRFSTPLQRLFKSNQNLTTTTTPATKSESVPKFYHRFSVSMQTLFSGNLSNNRKRNLSASDTSLNKRFALSHQELIDNDYCPSVMYNRKSRKPNTIKNSDKTQTFSRWTNQLLQKFSRRKSDPKARKS